MGIVFALVLLSLLIWGIFKEPGAAISCSGLLIFLLGLVPLSAITSFHPFMLLAIVQAVSTNAAVPIGIGLMGLGRLVTAAERRARTEL